ncbi:hypothetical protein Val02_11520 [Virgisporangium aliadipatigenens]|uniref:DUF2975 domain-containing protein n=1 Tax=Virgisporangium aliadipatigenens TaxID=741659 RepID=A0A8J3YFW1_9ACTN|nr:DUF2975 domain-containing protein [Virgisporangium aliadipatigenens]GIJ44266.1 hypothetical protein Val02_11520 [Virgisporangium aliadipatigenens]
MRSVAPALRGLLVLMSARQLVVLGLAWQDATLDGPPLPRLLRDLVAHGAVTAVVALALLWQAWRLVDRMTVAQPFTVANARGLRRLGIAVLAGGAFAEAVRFAAETAMRGEGQPGWWWLPLGSAFVAFGRVVEHGRTVRADLDGLV